MIGEGGRHAHRTDVEVHFLEFLDTDVGRHFPQADREVRAFHLAGQNDFQPVARAFVAEDAQVVLRSIDRLEERQALDVVPMRVRQQQGQVERLRLEFGDQLAPEQAYARAGVQYDDPAIGPDFDTGSVAAVLYSGRPGRGNGAPHAPEFHDCVHGAVWQILSPIGANPGPD